MLWRKVGIASLNVRAHHQAIDFHEQSRFRHAVEAKGGCLPPSLRSMFFISKFFIFN